MWLDTVIDSRMQQTFLRLQEKMAKRQERQELVRDQQIQRSHMESQIGNTVDSEERPIMTHTSMMEVFSTVIDQKLRQLLQAKSSTNKGNTQSHNRQNQQQHQLQQYKLRRNNMNMNRKQTHANQPQQQRQPSTQRQQKPNQNRKSGRSSQSSQRRLQNRTFKDDNTDDTTVTNTIYNCSEANSFTSPSEEGDIHMPSQPLSLPPRTGILRRHDIQFPQLDHQQHQYRVQQNTPRPKFSDNKPQQQQRPSKRLGQLTSASSYTPRRRSRSRSVSFSGDDVAIPKLSATTPHHRNNNNNKTQ